MLVTKALNAENADLWSYMYLQSPLSTADFNLRYKFLQ